MNFDPSSHRLIPPSQLFSQLAPTAKTPAKTSEKPIPAQPPVAKPVTSSVPPKVSQPPAKKWALSLPTASAGSLANLSFVSQTPAQVIAPSSPSVSRSAQRLALPARPANALSGSEFIASIQQLSGAQREDAILQQILAGNVPEQQRNFKQLQLSAKGSDGQVHNATVNVMPDYLAVGSDADQVLVPLTPLTAQKIADATGTVLPTRKLVNDIYASAEVKLQPSPKPPGAKMTSTAYFAEHNTTVQKQRLAANAKPGQLIAGHKKDVVISNSLDRKPGTVAIYGWHQPTKNQQGKAIQPLSTIHEDTYADYSHGIRLIGGTVNVDGVERSTAEVLRDPVLAALLSDEGPIKNSRIKLR